MSKISELSDGGSLTSTDYLIAVRSGGNVKVKMDTINVDQITLGDNEMIRLGNSQDLTMVHNATNSIINQAGIGDLLLQKAGTTKASITANGLEFPDNSKAIFGSATDLAIYSDGINSYIQEGSGTSGIRITTDNSVSIRKHDDENIAVFNVDGAVRLYHDNAERIATTATGIDVTGDITLGDTNPTITFEDSSITNLSHTVSSASDNLRLAVDVNGVDAGSRVEIFDGSTEVARFSAGAMDVTGSVTADGLTVNSGTANNVATFTSTDAYALIKFEDNDTTTETTLGAFDNDMVFRVGASERIRIEGATGNVGIGTSTPSSALDVTGTVTADGFETDTSNTSKILLARNSVNTAVYVQNGGTGPVFEARSGSMLAGQGDAHLHVANNGDISFYNDAAAQGLFWDSSASALGLGTTTPSAKLSIYDASSADSTGLVISNGFTTDTAGDATEIMFQHYRSYSPSVTDSAFIKATKTQAWDATGYRTSKLEFGTRNGATEPETRMTIMPDGSVGIGTSLPSSYVSSASNLVIAGSAGSGMTIASGTGSAGNLFFADGTVTDSAYRGYVQYNHSTDALILGTAATAAVTIDSSQNLLVGTTVAADQGVTIYGNGANGIYSKTTATSAYWITNDGITSTTGTLFAFYNNATPCGSVTISSTNVTNYNSVSDQRLKENIADADDAGSKIDAIQVRKFDWKAGGEHQDYGFIAQELLEVAPVAVSVPEDPEEMMGVDPAKLVPMMLKEIQSLRARVAQLES